MSKQLRIWLFVLLGLLLTSTALLAEGVITMTTTQEVGTTIRLGIYSNGRAFIKGAQPTGETAPDYRGMIYTIKSRTITILGDVTYLKCYPEGLISLDVSGCPTLTQLYCSYNQLTSLDVSKNTRLWKLDCSLNQLTSLDVSKNTALEELSCSSNQLTSLDVSKNTALEELSCSSNQLTSLDVSKNTALTSLSCSDNQLTSLDVSKNSFLKTLEFYRNQLTSLNASGCSYLTELDCKSNPLRRLDVSGCTALTKLECYKNQLTNLDVSSCTALTSLYCYNNQLTNLDVSSCTALTSLYCYNNQLTSLNVSGCTALTTLSCFGNQLTGLDLTRCTALITLNCFNNQLTSLDLSKNVALTALNCSNNQLTSLDVTGCTALTYLRCSKNQLTNLPLSACISLTYLDCYDNQLTSLDVSDCRSLKSLNCTRNKIKSAEMSQLINSLPNRKGYEFGSLYVVDKSVPTEENFCYQYDIEVARNKNWSSSYSGEPNRTCAVTKTVEGKGTLSITGAADLGVVAYGTMLTVVATPEKNYKLVALTANGVDITATKKFLVKDDVIVKAVFKGKDFKVSLKQDGEGDLSVTRVDNLDAVPYGTELTIIANPKKGYELTSLIANGVNITNTKKVTVRGNLTIKATFTQKMRNFVVSLTKEGEGTITATGADDLSAVAYGTELTINATPAEGYELTALTANGTDILASKKVTVQGATEVKATFTKKNFVVTLEKAGEGELSTTGTDNLKKVPYGTELTINATPAAGYELVSITANGADSTATKKVVVTDNMTIKATFAKKSFAVSLTKEGEGTITATGATSLDAVAYGTELTIVATPAEGYELQSLVAGGVDITATKNIVVTDNLTVKATFTKKSFAVSLTKVGEGTISATGASNLNSVAYGTELTINATPAEGYELTALTANGTDILASQRVTIKEAVDVKATFAKKHLKVSTEKVSEGLFEVTGADDLNSVLYGTELTVSVTPATGYELTSLMANDTDISATKKVIVKENLTIKATFTKKAFAVSLTKEGEGTLAASGAEDLKAVPYGTEVTIVATPATGYELKSIEANGTDITATKKVVVREAVAVKATFVKKTFAVELTKESEGTIAASGAEDLSAVPYGTKLTITATPAEGYELVALVANNVDISDTKSIEVTEPMTIKATFAKKSFAVTFDKVGEGTITATGATSLDAVAYGTELTIVATPATGYELTALTANGTDILASKKVIVKEAVEVKATFAKKSFAVTFAKEGEGTISATGANDLNAVAYDTELTIVATPATGYELVSITANGADITATKKIVVTDNMTIKATFAKKSFAVSFDKVGEGTISATGASNLNSVAYGTELTINATPATGYKLVSITANGTDITATKKIVVKDNMTVKATFAKKNFAVSLTKEGEGTISATGANDLNAVAYGTELTINATPAAGYELVSITANGTDITATKKIVVTDNMPIKATFTKKNFAVSLTKDGEGTISATGANDLNAVAYGTELTINATPAEGYELTALTANGTDIHATKKVVVEGNLTVKATFAKKSFAVSLTKEGEGTISATGANDLNAVAYSTELTIVATPAEGYELVSITANGADITATKKIVVKDNMTIKATFEKKTFAVMLTSNEHGEITIVEPVNLKAVSYGTTLTVKATGKNAQCVLTELTANGEDILATQSFVVTGPTEVKATFVDHTGVETTITQQVKLYPNPATDYVIVEGVAPASEVTLHSMTGERLYAGRADDRGTLQIDLTPYADGVYLVCVAGETYRVVVRHSLVVSLRTCATLHPAQAPSSYIHTTLPANTNQFTLNTNRL